MACPRDFMELPLSCGNEEALRCYNDGLRLLFKYVGGGVSLLEKACELDNSLILAHCAVVSIRPLVLPGAYEPPYGTSPLRIQDMFVLT